jgi:hypothetical protein
MPILSTPELKSVGQSNDNLRACGSAPNPVKVDPGNWLYIFKPLFNVMDRINEKPWSLVTRQ